MVVKRNLQFEQKNDGKLVIKETFKVASFPGHTEDFFLKPSQVAIHNMGHGRHLLTI